MRCPSCDADSEISDICNQCGSVFFQEANDTAFSSLEGTMNPTSEASNQPRKASTLIEFPGVTRASVPEWRKELSERVREVQERRAREAARETAEVGDEIEESLDAPPQLELIPHAELPPVNPLVAAALKRIERAHRPVRTQAAAAVAYAPSREDNESDRRLIFAAVPGFELDSNTDVLEPEVVPESKVEKVPVLVVVPPPSSEPEVKTEPPPTPRRLIIDDDPVLNYLDSISRTVRVDEIDTRRASIFKRFICGILDLFICVLLSSPVAIAMFLTGTDLNDSRAIAVIAACAVLLAFIYLTLTTALTGRTLAMRVLSLRVIDKKTGLIPTGGQSAARALFYLVSLGAAGLGVLFVLISRDGNTAHDQFTGTSVIAT